jgi:hypothetical protein
MKRASSLVLKTQRMSWKVRKSKARHEGETEKDMDGMGR